MEEELMEKSPERIRIVGINARFSHSCLALFYVRNELEKHCPGVVGEIVQATINDNVFELLLRLSEGAPRVVFFSASIWNSILVERLCRDLHLCLPGCRMVLGGPQAAVLGARLGPEFTTVVLGEIEAVDPAFYRDLLSGTLRRSYAALSTEGPRPPFGNPYRPEDFSGPLANRSIYYESSRGCPFHCSYCLSAAEHGVRHKDLAEVLAELSLILACRPKVVRFVDRTFNDQPQRALAIWHMLAACGGETLFHFEIAPERFSEEMFAFLAGIPPGRFQFEIGVQSTNPATLAAINRRIDPEVAAGTVRRLAGPGNIHLHVDLILGLPYETRESFAGSFRDIFALGAHYVQMGLLKILPDTPISRQAADWGYRYSSDPPYGVFCSQWLDHPGLAELYHFSEVVERFVNTRYFVSLWSYLRRINEDAFAFFEKLLAICRRQDFFQRAPTQELLCTILVTAAEERHDRALLVELLRYDWLRCGFRFLPDALQLPADVESPAATRSALYQRLPPVLPGLYQPSERNHFFRKSFFLRVSRELLREIGLEEGGAESVICFLAEREKSLYGLQRVVCL
jgi:radical SAM superfamily enzyme YgiQ (UPF0313 family)